MQYNVGKISLQWSRCQKNAENCLVFAEQKMYVKAIVVKHNFYSINAHLKYFCRIPRPHRDILSPVRRMWRQIYPTFLEWWSIPCVCFLPLRKIKKAQKCALKCSSWLGGISENIQRQWAQIKMLSQINNLFLLFGLQNYWVQYHCSQGCLWGVMRRKIMVTRVAQEK